MGDRTRIIFLFVILACLGVGYLCYRYVTSVCCTSDVITSISTREDHVSLDGDTVIIEGSLQNRLIQSPLTIRGSAPGTWFFEAVFPVVIVDWDGRIIGSGHVTSLDDWMTTEYVDFEGTIEFETPSYGDTGAIILQKENPSGLPEYDDAVEIPIQF